MILVLLTAACNPVEEELFTATPVFTSTVLPSATQTAIPTPSTTATPTATSTVIPGWTSFESEWLTLYYPPDWNVESPREYACAPGSTDCIIRLSHLPTEKIEIELIRYPPGIPANANVKQADKRDWDNTVLGAKMTNASDYLELISRTEISIDNLEAIRRIYEYPLVDPATFAILETQYNYQVLVMQGEDLYFFRMYSTDAGEFEKYVNIADEIVRTIDFQR